MLRNKLLSYIPKRLRSHVQDVYRDSDGIWVEGDKYFFDTTNQCHCLHCYSINELRDEIKFVVVLEDGDANCVD